MSKLAFLLFQNLAKSFNVVKIPLNVPPGGKLFLTLAVNTFLYLHQNFHENNSPAHEITSIFKNRPIMPTFTCMFSDVGGQIMPKFTCSDGLKCPMVISELVPDL